MVLLHEVQDVQLEPKTACEDSDLRRVYQRRLGGENRIPPVPWNAQALLHWTPSRQFRSGLYSLLIGFHYALLTLRTRPWSSNADCHQLSPSLSFNLILIDHLLIKVMLSIQLPAINSLKIHILNQRVRRQGHMSSSHTWCAVGAGVAW